MDVLDDRRIEIPMRDILYKKHPCMEFYDNYQLCIASARVPGECNSWIDDMSECMTHKERDRRTREMILRYDELYRTGKLPEGVPTPTELDKNSKVSSFPLPFDLRK